MRHKVYRVVTLCVCGFMLFFNSGLCFAQTASQPAIGSQAHPNVGSIAPDFTLQDQDEKQVSLHDFRGKNVVVVFYVFCFSPKANQELSALKAEAEKWDAKAQFLAVSVDTVPVNHAFADTLGLKFPLLSDSEMKVGSLYGAYSPRSRVTAVDYRRAQATWVIDPRGRILATRRGEAALNPMPFFEGLKDGEPSPQ